jgi:hypothetical protein
MIRKWYLVLPLFLTVVSVAAAEDEEMLQNLEFFKSFHLVKKLDDLQENPGSAEIEQKLLFKKIEVKNETH